MILQFLFGNQKLPRERKSLIVISSIAIRNFAVYL
jgi:hypothetical protein